MKVALLATAAASALTHLVRPLFARDRQAAHSFAKTRAAEFDAADYHADGAEPYFYGRDAVKRLSHRFIIKSAMPA
jgi:hypothetical protein